MYERRGVDLTRRFFLLFVSIALGSSCFLPPDPPNVEEEPERRQMIRGAWDSPADSTEGADPDEAGTARVIAPVDWDAGGVVMAGQWSAEVMPEGSEAMPEVSLSLFDAALEGEVVGTATYDFPGYACHYALILESADGSSVELSQRWGVGPCAEAGRIVLEWDTEDVLLGDWRRPDGRRWFQVRLTPTPPTDAEIESEGMSGRGRGGGPARTGRPAAS